MPMLVASNYYGGKARKQVNDWIQSLLPTDSNTTYIEPFAGMLGILLNRPRSAVEIVNDYNENIVAFWRGVRDYPNEMSHMCVCSPHSRSIYEECWAGIETGAFRDDPVRHAWAVWYILNTGLIKGFTKSFGLAFVDKGRDRGYKFSRRVEMLCSRISDVQLENRDALEFLDVTKKRDYAIIYCDPPYFGSNVEAYQTPPLSLNAFCDALQAQTGRVAVSGYGNTYDHLGWQKHSKRVQFTHPGNNPSLKGDSRVECLWTNYEAGGEQMTLL